MDEQKKTKVEEQPKKYILNIPRDWRCSARAQWEKRAPNDNASKHLNYDVDTPHECRFHF